MCVCVCVCVCVCACVCIRHTMNLRSFSTNKVRVKRNDFNNLIKS